MLPAYTLKPQVAVWQAALDKLIVVEGSPLVKLASYARVLGSHLLPHGLVV